MLGVCHMTPVIFDLAVQRRAHVIACSFIVKLDVTTEKDDLSLLTLNIQSSFNFRQEGAIAVPALFWIRLLDCLGGIQRM